MSTSSLENLICTVATLGRDELKHRFLEFKGRFPVDFTAEYLENLSLDRLRHIFVALCVQNEMADIAA